MCSSRSVERDKRTFVTNVRPTNASPVPDKETRALLASDSHQCTSCCQETHAVCPSPCAHTTPHTKEAAREHSDCICVRHSLCSLLVCPVGIPADTHPPATPSTALCSARGSVQQLRSNCVAPGRQHRGGRNPFGIGKHANTTISVVQSACATIRFAFCGPSHPASKAYTLNLSPNAALSL